MERVFIWKEILTTIFDQLNVPLYIKKIFLTGF